MKLTGVEIHPSNSSDVAVLSFKDPSASNSYNVKDITGLDADEIIPRYYGGYSGPLGVYKFYNLSLEKKEIVFKIGLNPNFGNNETYSDLRDAFYKMISSSRTGKIQIQFINGEDAVAAISGFISKFEAPLFEKTQEIQLTVKCDDPMLKALEAISVSVGSLIPGNTIIQDDISTAPHGFKFEVTFLANTLYFILSEVGASDLWAFSVAPIGGFLTGDVLHVSSEYNDKYIYVVRGGTTIHLGDAIVPGAVWPILFPGTNAFELWSPENLQWTSLSYYPTFWGV